MDQDTSKAVADLRYQLNQLRTALGVNDNNQAEVEVRQLKDTVAALVEWAATVSPPFQVAAS